MVIIHIANIDTSIIGGVQFAVPKIVKTQSEFADVCLINTHNDVIDQINTIQYNGKFEIENLPKPYNKPDLIVFHEVYRFEFISIYKKLLKIGIPYVIIPHGSFSKKAQQKKRIKKSTANFIFFNKFVKNARLIQYLSSNEQSMSSFKNYPFLVLGNGVDIPVEKKMSFEKSLIKFIYIGRLEINIKGLDLMLAAVKNNEMLFREKCAELEIYGPDYNGSHEDIKRMINKFKIEDIVRLGKEKLGIEKQQIIRSATCFIQTSRTEGLPLGPLEALSYGVPCIVTEGVGLGEIIELYGAGYKCDNTVEGITESIERFILNINDLEQMSHSAIDLIEKNYDIKAIAMKTIEEYFKILN